MYIYACIYFIQIKRFQIKTFIFPNFCNIIYCTTSRVNVCPLSFVLIFSLSPSLSTLVEYIQNKKITFLFQMNNAKNHSRKKGSKKTVN